MKPNTMSGLFVFSTDISRRATDAATPASALTDNTLLLLKKDTYNVCMQGNEGDVNEEKE